MKRKIIRREPQSFASDTAHAARVGVVLCCILTGIVWAVFHEVRLHAQNVSQEETQ